MDKVNRKVFSREDITKDERRYEWIINVGRIFDSRELLFFFSVELMLCDVNAHISFNAVMLGLWLFAYCLLCAMPYHIDIDWLQHSRRLMQHDTIYHLQAMCTIGRRLIDFFSIVRIWYFFGANERLLFIGVTTFETRNSFIFNDLHNCLMSD